MNFLLIAAFAFAGLEALALQKNWFKLEIVAKPAVMLCLFFWLLLTVGLEGALFWFGLGILLSLVGDVLLMISLDRLFLMGLGAFLLAHIFYVIGFNIPLPALSAWSVILVVLIGWGGSKVIRRILVSVDEKGQGRMRLPIILYSMVISVMLLSAMIKLNDLTWTASAALLVSLGAFLFYLSDIILAWNKFVTPIPHGRIYNIAAYHLGQILLIAGVVAQFGK
ncbi:MAG: lysoplasmalogenase [Anaerolineae bacterium]|nr:lysoplasmalogenase [Anaerolineae bacterium]